MYYISNKKITKEMFVRKVVLRHKELFPKRKRIRIKQVKAVLKALEEVVVENLINEEKATVKISKLGKFKNKVYFWKGRSYRIPVFKFSKKMKLLTNNFK